MAIKDVYSLVTPAGTNEQTGVGQITVTASSNSREYPELANFSKGLLWLDVSAVSGTPSVVVALQHQDPFSGKWQNVTGGAFAAQTAVTGGTPLAPLAVDLVAKNYRLAWTVSGGTPSMTFSCGITVHTEEPVP